MLTLEERTNDMLDRYGECCNRTAAAKILGRSVSHIGTMLKDGRLEYACGGTMVDMRSIARYISQPKQEDFEARRRKAMLNNRSNWAV